MCQIHDISKFTRQGVTLTKRWQNYSWLEMKRKLTCWGVAQGREVYAAIPTHQQRHQKSSSSLQLHRDGRWWCLDCTAEHRATASTTSYLLTPPATNKVKGCDIYIPPLTGKPWAAAVYNAKWHNNNLSVLLRKDGQAEFAKVTKWVVYLMAHQHIKVVSVP